MSGANDDRLKSYRAKRAASATPEPFGGEASGGARLFVVQKHHARSLHWDLRLEMDGALESWAVPRGPSADPADKRLAMHVEPHPLEYADFEGVIPEGQYGAGPSICWDRGTWIEIPGDKHGLEHGKLLFELRGYKLRGLWTLVHTPRAGRNHWLLIKERDAYVDERGTEAFPDDSIYSGLLVDELPDPGAKLAALLERARGAGAREGAPAPGDVGLMLATARERPFSDDGWVFELKYDGYRLLAGRRRGEPLLLSRNGHDLTETFPEIARAVRGLPFDGVLLDGEVVVHDERGLPSFGRLQKRGRLQRRADIVRAARELPASLYAFDLLTLDDLDLRGLPLTERKALLRDLLPSVGPIRYSEHIRAQGEAMYRQVQEMRLEGIVAKKADAPYRGGRSRAWYKIRTVRTDDFVVVGWTDPAGGRSGFGALHLAQWVDDELVYAGSVGTGFSDAALVALEARLEALAAEDGAPPCAGPCPKGRKHHWVRPELVAEVRFRELTEAGVVRHPSFVRLREDKRAEECVRQGVGEVLAEPVRVVDRAPERHVPFTNLDKVFWPDAGYTKGDLIEYYRAVWPWMEPYLEDRCLVLTRYPDGIDGNSFYQKNAPEWAPEWIRTVRVWSEGSERELDYFVVEDLESLLYVANSAAIVLHVWSSRVATLGQPDWCILDLDPKGAPFEHVVKVARLIRQVCEHIELPAFVKTSGSTGLHVLLPLGRAFTYEQSRMLGHLLANVVVAELPDIATVTRQVRAREGKVYVDYLQNGHGQLLVAPFSARPVPEAAVSTPLRWSEVKRGLDVRAHTIRTVPARMKRLRGGDPLLPVLDTRPDLAGALERLAGLVG
ncbi:MAG: DNA ligase D [Gemmatimonadetes bacterium]|nr:MAG: DNA ligase D [Gemmatimonadota bacterium]